jgi:hypothetical protein
MKSYWVNKWSLNLKFNQYFESYLHLMLFYPSDQKLGQKQKLKQNNCNHTFKQSVEVLELREKHRWCLAYEDG